MEPNRKALKAKEDQCQIHWCDGVSCDSVLFCIFNPAGRVSVVSLINGVLSLPIQAPIKKLMLTKLKGGNQP